MKTEEIEVLKNIIKTLNTKVDKLNKQVIKLTIKISRIEGVPDGDEKYIESRKKIFALETDNKLAVINSIVEEVEKALRIKREYIFMNSRKPEIVFARGLIFYILKDDYKFKEGEMQKIFALHFNFMRDRSTLYHAISSFQEEILANFNNQYKYELETYKNIRINLGLK